MYNTDLEEKIETAVKGWRKTEKKKMFTLHPRGALVVAGRKRRGMLAHQGQHGLRHLEGLPDRAHGQGRGSAEPEGEEHQALRHHGQTHGRLGHGCRRGLEAFNKLAKWLAIAKAHAASLPEKSGRLKSRKTKMLKYYNR